MCKHEICGKYSFTENMTSKLKVSVFLKPFGYHRNHSRFVTKALQGNSWHMLTKIHQVAATFLHHQESSERISVLK